MAKMSKKQRKNAYESILSKSTKLLLTGSMSSKDYMAVERIIQKYLKRF